MSPNHTATAFSADALSNVNSLWGAFCMDVLARCGVETLVVSPGSRSTPLTCAAAAHPAIEAIPVLDERSAGFFALGIARRTHRPVALVCTSGTAVANYLPAVIEARESHVPLLVLSADRPPEMRDCRSGQTIDQLKIFGDYPVFHAELPVPTAEPVLLRALRTRICHAVECSLGPVAGPAHLNFPFRDPLAPQPGMRLRLDFDPAGLTHGITPPRPPQLRPDAQTEVDAPVLIIAGPCQPASLEAYIDGVARLTEALPGAVVLADALNPLRHHAARIACPIIAHYDTILRDTVRAAELAPRQFIVLDELPTSKVLRAWLGEHHATPRLFVAGNDADARDATHGATRYLRCPTAEAHRWIAATDSARDCADAEPFARRWRDAETRATRALDAAFAKAPPSFEGALMRGLAAHLPHGTAVCIASSMPVRDAEYFWPLNDHAHRIYFNRGANGIDGTVSTAFGIAHRGAPTVMITGDLAFLHDSNALLLAPQLRGGLTIVVINNNGGGIFEHLPVADAFGEFERYFATPQRVDIGRLVTAHGIPWQAFDSAPTLLARLRETPVGLRVLELRCDRKTDAATRRRILASG